MTPRLIPRIRIALACAVLLLAALNATAIRGQAEADASASGLQVRSAEYNADTNTIAVALANETQKSVTAYGLDITVASGGKTLAQTEYGNDLLNLVLNGRGKKGAEESWVGAIQPGDIHTDSIPANVTAAPEVAGPIEVHVQVMVALWSDGAVEGTNQFMIKQMQDSRLATLHAEEKVLALLHAHSGDGDAQASIAGVLNDLALLTKSPQQASDLPASEILNSTVLNDAVSNLTEIKSSANTAAQLRVYAADFAATHQRRVVFLQSMGQS